MAQPMATIKANVNPASNATETIRPKPRRWSALSKGLSRKVSKIASATGIRTARAQYIEATINTNVPTTISGDNFRDLGGTERGPFGCC
jgi:hypothetical protein